MLKLKSLPINRKGFAIAVFFLLTTCVLHAQEPPGFEDESPWGVTDAQVPFDDWVFVLVAVVIGYVLIKAKIYTKNKNKGTALSD